MTTVTIRNPRDFANAVLTDLGDPTGSTDTTNVVGWEAQEGGNWHNTAKYNPLNTTQPEPGSVNFDTGKPGGGVQAYTSWQEGVDATVATLNQNQVGYPKIITDLATSDDWKTFAGDVDASAWGTKGLVPTSPPPPSGSGNPDSQSYGTGLLGGSTGNPNKPNPSDNGANLSGLAGILQSLDGLYQPPSPSLIANLTSLGTASVQSVATMIFVRAISSALFIGIIAMGIKTLSSGGIGGSGGGGATNVLEFVNASKMQARKADLSEQRIRNASEKEERVNVRHYSGLASKERVAATPRTTHIWHHNSKGDSTRTP
jgi:hypothetical protein